jgi:hypothetical protein
LNDVIDRDTTEDDARRHGLWGLGVLAMIAVVVVSFMILFTGGKEGDEDATSIQDDSTLSGALPSSGRQGSPNSTHPARRSTTSTPRTTGGANLQALAAGINELRIKQGLSAVTAGPSENAQECAAARGEGPTCVPHFMWTQVDSPDAESAVKSLQNVNQSWLLDPTTTRFEIGWSRDPGGRYNCVVLKFP